MPLRQSCAHAIETLDLHLPSEAHLPRVSEFAVQDAMDTAVLQTYVHIVDEGSFAAAARRMGISKSLTSKYISDLEAVLGARLLTRTTRSVRPTDVGLQYYDQVKDVLARLSEANEAVRQVSKHASGRLRIASPISYTLKVLQPRVMRFVEEFPEVQLDLVLDDGANNVVGEGFDAVIRVGELEDSSLFARRLHAVKVLTVASPEYLATFGAPARPTDLLAHRCLYYTNIKGAGTWPFQLGNEIVYQKVHPFFSSNNGEMIRAAALEGKGIAMGVDFLVDDDLAAGRLVQVLPEFSLPDLPVNLVYPSPRNMTAALRAFMDFMLEQKI